MAVVAKPLQNVIRCRRRYGWVARALTASRAWWTQQANTDLRDWKAGCGNRAVFMNSVAPASRQGRHR